MTLEVGEALLSCGELRREEIPGLAVQLLESGIDSPIVRELAGLSGEELYGAHDLFRRVLSEMGRSSPRSDQAARILARDLAAQVVGGGNLRGLAASGARYAAALDYHRDLMPFYVADDEYDDPGMWPPAAVDQELIRYARSVLESNARALGKAEMLTIGECERVLVDSIRADKELSPSVEDLLAGLLSGVAGYHARSTDGVILEYSRVAAGQMVTSGVVFMVGDQTVEPVRVELVLDASSAKVLEGAVFFGDKTRTAHGSWDVRELRDTMVANPLAEFSWKECFHRHSDGWQRGLPE